MLTCVYILSSHWDGAFQQAMCWAEFLAFIASPGLSLDGFLKKGFRAHLIQARART